MKFPSLAIICSLFLGYSVSAQELWGGARVGMTLTEAQRAYPQAAAPDRANSIPRTGAVEMLRVDNVDVGAAVKLRASLFFSKDGLLQQVNLEPMNAALTRLDASMLFDHIVMGLKAKYGSPLNESRQGVSSSSMRELTWINQKTRINATTYSLSPADGFLSVIYTGDGQGLGSNL